MGRKPTRPSIQLVSNQESYWQILKMAMESARAFGWSEEQVKAFVAESKQGDFEHMKATIHKHFDVLKRHPAA